jgi:peptidoglycan-associated lipoprotein
LSCPPENHLVTLATPLISQQFASTRSRVLSVALLALLGACSSTPPAAPPASAPVDVKTSAAAVAAAKPAPAPAPALMAAPAPAEPRPAANASATTTALPAYLDPNSDISKRRSVFFEFDQADFTSASRSVVELHGKYLSSQPKLAIRIEGNADERGSTEYNLALGQKRAESVRRALKLVGVADTQMETVSWGEERPKATGHDEAAWSQNRRADLQYPAR